MPRETIIHTLFTQFGEILHKIGHWFSIKAIIAIGVISIDFLIGRENHTSMTMLIVLIAFDMVTAIIAEYKCGRPIESRKALKTATKIVVYGLMVSAAHLTEQIVPGTTFIDSAVISFLAVTELISILENAGKSGYAIPKKLLNRLDDLRDK